MSECDHRWVLQHQRLVDVHIYTPRRRRWRHLDLEQPRHWKYCGYREHKMEYHWYCSRCRTFETTEEVRMTHEEIRAQGFAYWQWVGDERVWVIPEMLKLRGQPRV